MGVGPVALTTAADRILLLRCCGEQGEAHGGFRWPMTVGAVVSAPDWDPTPRCGGGLHGLPWGCGDWYLLTGTRWMVFSADPVDVVDIDGAKSKVKTARVEHVGTKASCTAFLAAAVNLSVTRGAIDATLLPGDGDGSGYGYGYGYGDGSGYGYGYGYGDGDGYGSGDGYGYGSGDGYGYGSGDGSGYGSGDGDGDGYGYGSGDGDGYGSGDGDGYGDGYGYGYGDGYGYGSGDGDGYGYGSGSGDGDGDGYGDE